MYDPLATLETRRRLSRLAGLLCPLCAATRPVLFDGVRLSCLAGHGWSNADAAEADLVEERPASLAEQQARLTEKRAAEAAECGRLLERLESAVGDWLPPEANP